MAIMACRPQKGRYPTAPVGLHEAVCVDVVDLGIVQNAYGSRHKVRLIWQLGALDETRGRRFDVARVYTLSLHEKAALRKDLESWRGRKFTEPELDGFDLERLIGVNCQLQTTQDLGDDGVLYANVMTVIPARKGAPKLFALDYVRVKDRTTTAPAAEETDDDDIPF